MKLKWYGQACFLLTNDDGKKILMDPFNEMGDYRLPDTKVDIVSVSHEHFDHNNTKDVKGSFKLFNKPGYYTLDDISIIGIHSFHDNLRGSIRGDNTIFKYKIDGLSICHLGDLGHSLTTEQISKLGHIDILMIPVGGVYTIDAKEAYHVVQQINPTITIPMHYQTEALDKTNLKLDPVDHFLNLMNKPIKEEKELDFNVKRINIYLGSIVILNYK